MSPERIFILRHAESEEDVNPDIYAELADLEIGLTEDGKLQVSSIGVELGAKLNSDEVAVYLSPGTRLYQTFEKLVATLPEIKFIPQEDARIKKQDWGHVTLENRSEIEAERYRAGVLEYQFPGGESGAELIERVDDFVESMGAEFDTDDHPDDAVIITHGFVMRVLIMRFLGMSREEFGGLAHPQNGFIAELVKVNEGYELKTELPKYQPDSNQDHIQQKK